MQYATQLLLSAADFSNTDSTELDSAQLVDITGGV